MTVALRQRKQKSEKISLYLDIYSNGKRKYEYLNLYLNESKNSKNRDANKETMALAEAIRSKRQVEIQNGAFGFKNLSNGNKDFLGFFADHAEGKTEMAKTTYNSWMRALKHLRQYTNGSLQFKEVDESFLEAYKSYLLTQKINNGKRLAQNTASLYFTKMRSAVKAAYEMDLISSNPTRRVKQVKLMESKRQYLTLEEVKKLSDTDCKYEVMKRSFMFSVLTGMRWSDIDKLTWQEVKQSDQTGSSIMFRQQKTDGLEYLPISEQALAILGERGADTDCVFPKLSYKNMSRDLAKWSKKAGITKAITFHCARHTHATLLLTNGIDLYTVSKLLGHKDIKSTQIYGKIIDQKKISAVNSIPNFM